jgi:glycosyltransferase involved in cell wall biosynthesis
MTKVALVMPVYNEADGIAEFLMEIDESLEGMTVIVVNDCSTDTTLEVVESLKLQNVDLRVVSNERNVGHGPTTLRALELGLASGADAIIAVDGDGQVDANQIGGLLQAFVTSSCDIVEGIRSDRHETAYRRFTSWATRVVTQIRVKRSVPDANTPFRVYQRDALEKVLTCLPTTSMVPNLWITVVSRRTNVKIMTYTISTRPRRGAVAGGSTWGRSPASLPSRRFIRFCARAFIEWFVLWRQVKQEMSRVSDS